MAITRLGGANAITGTLPAANINDTSIGNITALPAGVGGKVLQVVSSTQDFSSATTNTSFVSTPFALTITPTSSSNKIFLHLSGQFDNNATSQNIQATIYRGATNIGTSNGLYVLEGASRVLAGSSFMAYDSPSTTSATTYTLYIRSGNGQNVSFNNYSLRSTFVAFEIKG